MTCGSYNPGSAVTDPVWALPLSLATTRGITIVFSSSAYLDVSVQQVRLLILGCQAFSLTGCPIRKSGYHHLFAVTPGLSQLVTSFFASRSLGIPRAPLVTFRIPLTTSRYLLALFTLYFQYLYFLVARFESSLILFSRVFFFHHVNEPYALTGRVENKGVEPLTPSLQS